MSAFRIPTPPTTPDGWRIVTQAAAGLLAIDDLRLAGVLRGGPAIDRERCEQLIACAQEHGVEPVGDEVTRAAGLILLGFNGEPIDLGLGEPKHAWEGSC